MIKYERYEVCDTCKHWRRKRYHSELPEQIHWGYCARLVEINHELFAAYADTYGMRCNEIETRENFGCVCWGAVI
jgi:hypothetical protein